MLETILVPGSPAAWLPTAESATGGTGILCSHGVQDHIYQGRSKYLPFAPNGINWVASQGEDVISYNFTGCIMAVFVYQGSRRVCHVSTGPGQDCRDEWQRIKEASVNVSEFKPSDFIQTDGKIFSGCYGLITNDGHTFAITVVSTKDRVRIVSRIKPAPLLR